MSFIILAGPAQHETPFGTLVLPYTRNVVRGAKPTQPCSVSALLEIDGQTLPMNLGVVVTRGCMVQVGAFTVTEFTPTPRTARLPEPAFAGYAHSQMALDGARKVA